MSRKQKKVDEPAVNHEPPTNPPPASNPDVTTGLENIQLFGTSDADYFISTDSSFFQESFMTTDLFTAEDNNRFIKKVEALVRSSPEYKAYISYLRNDLKMNRCSFMPNLLIDEGEISLEMHHCPLTLFDIVDVIINHRLANNQAITTLTIADEVMRMHFENNVGIIPVSVSIHKLIHAGSILVHPAMIHGNWMNLLRIYPNGVSEALMTKLLAFVSITEEQLGESVNKIDASKATPLLRQDAVIPTYEQLELSLMVPASQ